MTEPAPINRRIGDYEVLAELNIGGMGEVLLARRIGVHNFEKLVAIKTIRKELADNKNLRTMFHDEARLVARIDHPAVAQVHDFGEDANDLYLVMEYVSGLSFRKLIKRKPDPLISARAMAEVCHGLHSAHELKDLNGNSLGVVHRDVSPENLMLTFSGRVKILDFGIAFMRDRETHATMLGQIKGKPAYMAPEQVMNDPIDRRTDVFVACIVLHELLTGNRLFVGDTLLATAMAVGKAQIEPPSKYAKSIPKGLDKIVMRGLERDPEKRFHSALDLAKALENVIFDKGGEDLAHYAERELVDDREKHNEWLRGVLVQKTSILPEAVGRPDGVSTRPINALEDTRRERFKNAEMEDEGATPFDDTVENLSPKKGGRRVVVPTVISAVLISAVALAYLFFPTRNPKPSKPSIEDVSVPLPTPGEDIDFKAVVVPKEKPVETENDTDETADPAKAVVKSPKKTTHGRIKPSGESPEVKTQENPAETAAQQEWGYLNVDADPYAIVRIDGKQIGTTPVLRFKVPAGEHTVVLLGPDDGEVRLSKTVEVRPNEVAGIISR